MRKREFEAYYDRYKSVITAIARKLAGTDDELVADLEQEGAVALWRLQPSRATKNPDAWIRQALKFRMVDYLRKNDPRLYESLDERMEAGDQVEQDGAGTLILRSPRRLQGSRRTVQDEEME